MIKPIDSLLAVLLFMLSVQYAEAQAGESVFLRSSMGNTGSSTLVETTKGVFILSQSIGQNSVIGTFTNKGYILMQGYQQPLKTLNVESVENSSLNLDIFPNPFTSGFSLAIQERLKEDFEVSVYDLNGRTIFKRVYKPVNLLEIQIENLSSGTYMLMVRTGARIFRAKLIKN
jgi:hypothetical protein